MGVSARRVSSFSGVVGSIRGRIRRRRTRSKLMGHIPRLGQLDRSVSGTAGAFVGTALRLRSTVRRCRHTRTGLNNTIAAVDGGISAVGRRVSGILRGTPAGLGITMGIGSTS